jgi:hypothetical protein
MHDKAVRGLVRTSALAAVLAVALAAAGCGQKPEGSGAASPSPGNPAAGSPAGVSSGEKTGQPPVQLHIKTYYGDEQAVQLVEAEAAISFKEEKDKYITGLEALKKAPSGSKLIPLAEALGFKSAALQNGKLTVDLTVSGEGRLGAPGEAMLLEAIKKTLFQFPEVGSVDILVDGKAADSLMGHMELPHPIKRGSQ